MAQNKQQQAISDYLEALLQDVPDEPVTETPVAEEPQPVAVGLENLVAEIAQPVTRLETKTEVVVDQQLEVQQEIEAAEALKAELAIMVADRADD